MFRKNLVLLILGFCTIFLVGCEKVVDLTDEETQLIAEYAAELLLKYDIYYVDRIDEGHQKAEELSSEMLENTMKEEMTTEAATGEVTTEESTKDDLTVEQDLETEMENDEALGTQQDIATIAGVEGAKITFREYYLSNEYPADDDGQGELISLEASEGYQLLVLQFDVVNTTDSVLPVSLIDKGLDYRIVANKTKAANPMLTILMDDLETLETNVEPDMPQKAVLIFQVSEDMQNGLETLDLYITHNELENVIRILE